MLNDQRWALATRIATDDQGHGQGEDDGHDEEQIRDIHPLSSPPPAASHPQLNRAHGTESWETSSHRSPALSNSSENFSSMSREFNALVVAGATIDNTTGYSDGHNNNNNNLRRIREEEMPPEDNNPLAIVPDNYNPPLNPEVSPSSPDRQGTMVGAPAVAANSSSSFTTSNQNSEVSFQRVKKEEVQSKINAWQTAKVAKVNNRFKREDAIITGWENEQVRKATTCMKKVERKLEEKRVKALEKMQNEIAKAHRKAEERRATAEAKRGTKVAKVLEIASLMRAVGRPPVKRSFF